jgi:hypothetical protein
VVLESRRIAEGQDRVSDLGHDVFSCFGILDDLGDHQFEFAVLDVRRREAETPAV